MADQARTAQQLRDMSKDDLGTLLEESKRDLFNFRVRSTTKEPMDPNSIRTVRRQIARIHTILREKAAAKG